MVDNTLTRVGMPLQEFIEETNTKMFELIKGERRYKVATVHGHTKTLRAMFRALDAYVVGHDLGEVYSEGTFILPDAYDSDWVTGSRTPDVMFVSKAQMAAYAAKTPDLDGRPLAVIPELVVEVVPPTDKLSEMDEKVDLYLADSVRLVIVADPQRRKVFVHSPDRENAQTLKGDMLLKGEDVLPGFEIAVSKLFE
jgi:Uma2 family endonuclease